MNALTDTTATEISSIHASLDALLSAIVQIDRGARPAGRSYSSADLMDEVMAVLRMTDHQRFAFHLAREPVREAIGYAVRRLGERLHELGGLRAMQEALGHVEDADNGSHRAAIIDKRWDGIGAWCS